MEMAECSIITYNTLFQDLKLMGNVNCLCTYFNNIRRISSGNMACYCHRLTYPTLPQSPHVEATKPSLP
jgi:hypothetical protein